MKNLNRYAALIIVLLFLFSCKKDNHETIADPVPEKVINYQDSISFSINDKQYTFDDKYSYGIGNQPINIKRSATVINNGKLAYETGGYYWYGVQDSTLYSVVYKVLSRQAANTFSIDFTKKFADKTLQGGIHLLYPKSNLEVFKLGKQSFAVDLDKENTLEGISINLAGADINKSLSTDVPGFSILIRSDLKNDIQNNSTFEITKIEQLKDNIYAIEAKFEVNLFDIDAKQYRLKNGFMRLVTNVVPGNGGTL
ncbi:hypothetical protein GCM10023149_20350 [Mucilaginibacter gynuensis]|uniref:Uncharacterized protein n=1 Tax=Mucilaginibacter gynuensis TaxID=1302236 RepID=A0ABP8GAT9_9SPHI